MASNRSGAHALDFRSASASSFRHFHLTTTPRSNPFQRTPQSSSKKPNQDGVHIEDVKQLNGQWLVAGTSGVVLIVVGTGTTMKQAQAQVYSRIRIFSSPTCTTALTSATAGWKTPTNSTTGATCVSSVFRRVFRQRTTTLPCSFCVSATSTSTPTILPAFPTPLPHHRPTTQPSRNRLPHYAKRVHAVNPQRAQQRHNVWHRNPLLQAIYAITTQTPSARAETSDQR